MPKRIFRDIFTLFQEAWETRDKFDRAVHKIDKPVTNFLRCCRRKSVIAQRVGDVVLTRCVYCAAWLVAIRDTKTFCRVPIREVGKMSDIVLMLRVCMILERGGPIVEAAAMGNLRYPEIPEKFLCDKYNVEMDEMEVWLAAGNWAFYSACLADGFIFKRVRGGNIL